MALLRFIVLQTVLAAALVALWLKGLLAIAFAGDNSYFALSVIAYGVLGLVFVAVGRTIDAGKVQDMLPVMAVIAMMVGIAYGALPAMAQSLMSSGDASKAVGGFMSAISTALTVSISALCSYLWIQINLWAVHGE